MPDAVFHAWSIEHFAALGVTALIAAAMIAAGRLQHRRLARAMEIALALVLVIQWPVSFWVNRSTGMLTSENMYPCHLCDFAAVLGVFALLTHRQFFVELLYFWGLAGTLQGLVTPALTLNWPNPRFLLFFVAHSGVVVAALYCVCGLRITPRARAKWVAWALLVPFAVVVGTFNSMVGANYGFLRRKPDTASLYDFFGEWPWYLGGAAMVGLIFFIILDLPFVIQRARTARE